MNMNEEQSHGPLRKLTGSMDNVRKSTTKPLEYSRNVTGIRNTNIILNVKIRSPKRMSRYKHQENANEYEKATVMLDE